MNDLQKTYIRNQILTMPMKVNQELSYRIQAKPETPTPHYLIITDDFHRIKSQDFIKNFARARTFGKYSEWEYLKARGMGRGAGNCQMELLLGFLKNPKYNIYPAIEFVEKHMRKLKEDGVVWGYDLQYLMTGLLNQHPRTAIDFTKNKRTDYAEFYKEVVIHD